MLIFISKRSSLDHCLRDQLEFMTIGVGLRISRGGYLFSEWDGGGGTFPKSEDPEKNFLGFLASTVKESSRLNSEVLFFWYPQTPISMSIQQVLGVLISV